MLDRSQWLFHVLTRQFWFRAALFSLAGVAAAVSGVVLAPFVPDWVTANVGARAIDEILKLLANSMLAVAVFSLTTIVAAYASATDSVTPRAAKLLMLDTTSKDMVGTFVGAFLYSVVGIIALSTELYGDEGRAILLGFTVALILIITVMLLRWVDYLAHFGRVVETIGLVEQATAEALQRRLEHPHLGAAPLEPGGIPHGAEPLSGPIGYVQHVDVGALEAYAKQYDIVVYVAAAPGKFVDPAHPLAYVLPGGGEAVERAVIDAFTIGSDRTFDQDPRFGLCVLAETASRALSPAVNDPGTAIDVIGRGVRVLAEWGRRCASAERRAPQCPNVRIAELDVDDLFDDVFGPIARDGAAMIEVHVRLQKGLATLASIPCPGFAEAACRLATLACAHGEVALALEQEKARVRALAEAVGSWTPPGTA